MIATAMVALLFADAGCVDASSPELRGGQIYIGTAEGAFLGPLQIKPGEQRTLRLYVRRGPSWEHPNACVTWHLDDPELAALDEKTGALTASKGAKHGALILVRATLLGRNSDFGATLHVFRPEANPLAGTWHETAQLPCEEKPAPAKFEPIRELELRADGGFSVTWHPFESYRDYWGTYEFDLESRRLKLKIEGGNSIPPDFKGEGHFVKEPGGKLRFEGIWLGAPKGEQGAKACGHVFSQ